MQRLLGFLDRLGGDFRSSLRRLRRSPLFALTTVVTFALGIAANSAIFSVMDALVLRPLAVPRLDRVVSVAEQRGSEYPSSVSLPDYLDFVEGAHGLAQLAAATQEYATLTLGGESNHVQLNRCTPNFFSVFQIQPQLGRIFAAGEDQPGHDNEAVLTHAFWQAHFGANAAALGREIVLDGRSYTVVGVMPQSFDHVAYADLYLPLAPTPAQRHDRKSRWYTRRGRLRDRTSVAAAGAELNGIAAGIARQSPRTNAGWTVFVRPLVQTINGDLTPTFMRLTLAATVLLMLVVCANISNLQFAYTLRRAPELAMRFALGSTRRRLLRGILIDSLTQSLLGAVAGIALSAVLLHVILAQMPARIERLIAGWSDIHLDGRTLLYSTAVAVAAGLVAGLAPAMAGARVELLEQLKAGGRSVSGSRSSHRLRNLLSGAQVMLAIGLVAGAACIAASMNTVLSAARKFDPTHALVFDAYLPATRFATPARQSAFLQESVERLRALPGVGSVTFTTGLPYNNTGVAWRDLAIAGDPAMPGEARTTQQITVEGDFFRSFGLRLQEGRYLLPSDQQEQPLVAVISERFARRYFGERKPLGRQIQLGRAPDQTAPATIVGVVDDVLYPWTDQVPQPAVYLSAGQVPPASGSFLIRTSGDPLLLAAPARAALASIDRGAPVDPAETYATYLHESLIGLSYVAAMLAADAAIALVLCGIGLFGVMANLVTERTHEIGIRFAIGAGRSSILLLLMRRCLAILGFGALGGLVLAFGVGRVLSNILENMRQAQPEILGVSVLLVGLLGAAAGYLPARKAAAIEPNEALRLQ